MKEIQLTQGKVAIVDDDQYEALSRHKWCVHNWDGYWYAERGAQRDGRWMTEKMHRVIMNAPNGIEVDHINGDGLDNCRANLRLATHAENMYNQRPRRDGTSQYKGIYWDKQHRAWRAQIMVDGHNIYLGDFNDEKDAAHTYDAAARRYFGEFAKTNF